jgi:hypothetical protein
LCGSQVVILGGLGVGPALHLPFGSVLRPTVGPPPLPQTLRPQKAAPPDLVPALPAAASNATRGNAPTTPTPTTTARTRGRSGSAPGHTQSTTVVVEPRAPTWERRRGEAFAWAVRLAFRLVWLFAIVILGVGILLAARAVLVFTSASWHTKRGRTKERLLRRLVRPLVDDRIGAVSGNTEMGNRGGLLGRWQHIEYVTGFNLALAVFAFKIDRESLRPLWGLPLQQFVYRQLMYLVIIESTVSAIAGTRAHWGSLERTGDIKITTTPA